MVQCRAATVRYMRGTKGQASARATGNGPALRGNRATHAVPPARFARRRRGGDTLPGKEKAGARPTPNQTNTRAERGSQICSVWGPRTRQG
eukprot:338291-Lingulodinium_polyedra.AAC.1